MTLVAYGLGISPGSGSGGGQDVPVDTILLTDVEPTLNLMDRIQVTGTPDIVSISDEEMLTVNLGTELMIEISDDSVKLILGDPSS